MAQTKNSERLLDRINSPADLRKLPVEALPLLLDKLMAVYQKTRAKSS